MVKNSLVEHKAFVYDLDELDIVVNYLTVLLPVCQVFTLTGSLGAGKTTLVKALLKSWGVTEAVTSPTFAYMNCYNGADHKRFCHFDLYRIQTVQEFMAAGFDEYLYVQNMWCLIEWPEPILPILTHDVCHLVLDYQGCDKRKIEITVHKSN